MFTIDGYIEISKNSDMSNSWLVPVCIYDSYGTYNLPNNGIYVYASTNDFSSSYFYMRHNKKFRIRRISGTIYLDYYTNDTLIRTISENYDAYPVMAICFLQSYYPGNNPYVGVSVSVRSNMGAVSYDGDVPYIISQGSGRGTYGGIISSPYNFPDIRYFFYEEKIGTPFNITYTTSQNGTISGVSSASFGDTVTLTVTPDTGYSLSSLAVYKTSSQDPVDYTKVNDTTYTFVMPDANVTITGIFVQVYEVSILALPTDKAIITVTPSGLIQPGRVVNFTVAPVENWIVSTVWFNAGVDYTWNPDTLSGSFTMPAKLVRGDVYLSNRLDPNDTGGTSEPEIPDGGFDNNSDVIAIPVQSDTGVVNQTAGKGLLTLWNPTVSEIADIGQYLYSTDWKDAAFQAFRDFFVKPLESAVSLHILPIVPSRSATKKNIRFGPHNSGVSAYQVTEQYKTVDLGVLYIEPYWDSYLDYNPFTKVQIFLPYIGTQDIDTDIVMGKYVGVRYKFDILTGACVAFLYTYENNTASVFAEFVGEAAMQLPLCSSDYSRVLGGIIQAAATVVTGRMVTGAAMKSSEGLVAAKSIELEQASNRLDTAMKKRPRTEGGKAAKEAAVAGAQEAKDKAADGLSMAQAKAGRTQASMYAAELRAVPYEVGSVMNGKANFTISGSVAGGAGLLGSQTPYLIIRRPKQSLPENYKKYVGYPSNIYAVLGTLSGFTRIEQADLTGIPCTDAELGMIYKALKEGVYL